LSSARWRARIIRPVDLDELKDAESAASAAAKVIAKANDGTIDMEAAETTKDDDKWFWAGFSSPITAANSPTGTGLPVSPQVQK
jgi:hypothetical protein